MDIEMVASTDISIGIQLYIYYLKNSRTTFQDYFFGVVWFLNIKEVKIPNTSCYA